ncbi:hypothetical protein [Bacillus subtilis]|uniref:hypothetical protein n=1 Tax=Bacillus subtilis TaxID=1423 RepID=UPI003F840687
MLENQHYIGNLVQQKEISISVTTEKRKRLIQQITLSSKTLISLLSLKIIFMLFNS